MNIVKLFWNNVPQRIYHDRPFISALYVTGDKAKENYSVLTPYLNFEQIFSDPVSMEANIKRRQMKLDFSKVCVKYKTYLQFEKEKNQIEHQRENVANKLKVLNKNNSNTSDQIENLKMEGKNLRENLKKLKERLYPIEDDFVHNFLNLPNCINLNCPNSDEPCLLYRQGVKGNKSSVKSRCHLKRTDLIDYKDETCFYLLGDAAHFDLNFTHNCVKYFTEKQFIQTTNPDFVRRVILEANATSLDKYHQVDEEDLESKINLLHLTGGGSFESFLGYITKLSVFPSVLPLRLVCSGRQYKHIPTTLGSKGILTALQSNVVQTFVATETSEQADEEMDKILNHTVDIFKKLDAHFQIVYLPAKDLTIAESLGASIQMYSNYYSEYIEVGRISNYTDFVSKRLLFNTRDMKEFSFPYIVGGTVVDVSKIIACLIENEKRLISPNYVENVNRSKIDEFKDLFSTI